jgi:hypothetical protein
MSDNAVAVVSQPNNGDGIAQRSPNANKRTKKQRKAHAKQLVEMVKQGMTLTAIAKEFGVTRTQVSLDWKKIEQQWAKEIVGDVNAMKGAEVALTYELQNEALEAWHKSKEEQVKTATESVTTDKGGGSQTTADGVRVPKGTQLNRAQIKKETSPGDPRFLQVAAQQSDARRKILGLDAPVKQAAIVDVTITGSTELHVRLARYAEVLGVESLTPDEAAALLSGDGLRESVDTERSLPETSGVS